MGKTSALLTAVVLLSGCFYESKNLGLGERGSEGGEAGDPEAGRAGLGDSPGGAGAGAVGGGTAGENQAGAAGQDPAGAAGLSEGGAAGQGRGGVAGQGTGGAAGQTDGGTAGQGQSGSAGQLAGAAGQGTAGTSSCDANSYDHDQNPATVCQAYTSCDPGYYVTVQPTPTSDRGCTACETGSFSSESNAQACTAHTPCAWDQDVTVAGTTTSDQTCGQGSPTRLIQGDKSDNAFGVAIDPEGNVYAVGGMSSADSDQWHAFMRKFDPTGFSLWLSDSGPIEVDASAEARGVALDAQGNIHVVGSTWGSLPGQDSAGGMDAFLQLYAQPVVEQTWQFGTAFFDRADAAVVDANGNLYVAGSTEGALDVPYTGDSYDAFVRKYDSSGAYLWTRQLGTPENDWGQDVALDADGNVYLVGYTLGALEGTHYGAGGDAYLRKYDPDGNVLLTWQYGTALGASASGVAVDGAGNVYVVGEVEGAFDGDSAGASDAYVMKFDPAGTRLWVRQFGDLDYESVTGVALDGEANVYVVGSTYGSIDAINAGSSDVFVRGYDTDGQLLLGRQFGSSGDDWGNDIAVSPNGDVFVVGAVSGTMDGQSPVGANDAFVRLVR